jgi:RNA polymerase sigma factor (sigma-70 family)
VIVLLLIVACFTQLNFSTNFLNLKNTRTLDEFYSIFASLTFPLRLTCGLPETAIFTYNRMELPAISPCPIKCNKVGGIMTGPVYQPQTDTSDLALMQAIAGGHAPALDELYARYSSAIFGFLMARLSDRQLAEEVLQDVMLAAWRSAGSFRGESKVLTWLLSIARNRAINAVRKRKVPVVPYNDALDSPTDDTGPFERLVRQSEQRAVREVLQRLPDHQREVLVLVFYHQLTEAEVADVLGIAVGTVKSRLYRGKEALRRALQHDLNADGSDVYSDIDVHNHEVSR